MTPGPKIPEIGDRVVCRSDRRVLRICSIEGDRVRLHESRHKKIPVTGRYIRDLAWDPVAGLWRSR